MGYSKNTANCSNCGKPKRPIHKKTRSKRNLCADCWKRNCSGIAAASYRGTPHISQTNFHNWERNHRHHEWALAIADIEAVYLRQNGICAITGRPLTNTLNDPDKMSLDRIDSNLGYTAGNIQLVTVAANLAKHELTTAELVRLAVDIVRVNSMPISVFLRELQQPARRRIFSLI